MTTAPAGLVQALLQARAQATLLSPPSQAPDGLSLDQAYAVAAAAEAALVAAGERPRGWKIGFTNRSIWPRYGVHQPIWGRVWHSSLMLLAGTEADVSLAGLVQPRIEPEVVFGFAAAPRHDMGDAELLACLDWVAHGVEIVHTHFDGWRFAGAADPVADFGLHGRLVVGPRVPVASWPGLGDDLARMTLQLRRGEQQVDQGQGAAVLDGPLHALRHWLAALHAQSPECRVAAGEVVTTGTLTDAWPVAPGEVWHTRPGDARLPRLSLRFTA